MLYQRYSNPIDLMQQMLQVGQFDEFISGVVKIRNETQVDEMRWQFWLHKVFDMEWEDYLFHCESAETPEAAMNDIETTVKANYEMMENFHPE